MVQQNYFLIYSEILDPSAKSVFPCDNIVTKKFWLQIISNIIYTLILRIFITYCFIKLFILIF